jgi:hypothetical protein
MIKKSLSVLFFFFLVGCQQKATFSFQIDENILQEGDLAFRRGTSIASRVVLAADRGSGYSHIGIIVKDIDGWKVIHAVPGETDEEYLEETIKKETLSQFFAPKKSVSGAIFRLDTTASIGLLAAEKAHTLFKRKLWFDHKYDLEDSTRMYCTELVYFVFKYAGIDISEGRRRSYPALQGEFILPSDILAHPNLKQIL